MCERARELEIEQSVSDMRFFSDKEGFKIDDYAPGEHWDKTCAPTFKWICFYIIVIDIGAFAWKCNRFSNNKFLNFITYLPTHSVIVV